MKEVTITAKRLKALLDIEYMLNSLIQGGVDNWSGYSDSLSEYFKYKKEEDRIAHCLTELSYIIAKASVEQASERGSGFIIHYDEEAVFTLIKDLIKEVKSEQ